MNSRSWVAPSIYTHYSTSNKEGSVLVCILQVIIYSKYNVGGVLNQLRVTILPFC